jgi:hypothetical protein
MASSRTALLFTCFLFHVERHINGFCFIGLDLPNFQPILDFVKIFWSRLEAIFGSLWEAKTAVSSAKVAAVVRLSVGKSAVYNRYRTGPRTLPCGTPDSIGMRDVCS